MEFLANWYILLIVVAVFLVFALIGYIVDSKNKGEESSGEVITVEGEKKEEVKEEINEVVEPEVKEEEKKDEATEEVKEEQLEETKEETKEEDNNIETL